MVDEEDEQLVRRLRLPKNNEVFGTVEQMLGASKMLVRCKDDKVRIARIPGKMKRKIWIREGDVVIVQPWPVQGDEKGDVIWRFTKPQVNRLIRQGLI
ncbi:MAG: translation initiation factor eIF-1A [Candidatus Hydrothermarchaeales archaeon]